MIIFLLLFSLSGLLCTMSRYYILNTHIILKGLADNKKASELILNSIGLDNMEPLQGTPLLQRPRRMNATIFLRFNKIIHCLNFLMI